MRENGKILALFCAAVFIAVLSLSGCVFINNGGDGDGGDSGGGTTVTKVICEELGNFFSTPYVTAFYPVDNTYGLNAFYVWEIDDASTPGGGEYYFHSTGERLTNWVPLENWQIPTTYWSAIRFALDGYDPYKFSTEDPFYLWYLPYTPGTSWQSKNGWTNDGTCPENDYMVGNRPRCVGKNQLDEDAPGLIDGRMYLFRMMMLIPLGGKQNRVQSCYELMFTSYTSH